MNTDYLKYDAASIEQYLKRRLIESGVFTDQVYPGSDTQLLINLFSWTFECLQYILNNNAGDVLFYDSKVYENMNRLVKLLSYNPKAYMTSYAEFLLAGEFPSDLTCECTIPKYSYILMGGEGSSGDEMAYSFVKDYTFNIKNGHIIYSNENPILYNGRFIRYEFSQQATGNKYESFVMNDINSFVDNDNVNVYVEYTNESGIKEYEKVKVVNSLVLDASPNDLACEKRLNENKEFEISFGDGIHGKTLKNGSRINVIYLKSNGPGGKIEPNEFKADRILLNIKGFTDNETFIDMIYEGRDNFKLNYGLLFSKGNSPTFETSMISLSNVSKSSDVLDYETVDEIRHNAPDSFRIGNRLVTAGDFRTYILSKYKNRINDVYVCNNNEYCTSFYRWLNKYDKLDVNIRLNSYEYANACDFNNIYIWMQPNVKQKLVESEKRMIIADCDRIKSLTTTLIPCNGIKVYFMPFVNNYKFDISECNILSRSYAPDMKIVIKKSRTYLSNETIKNNICKIILDYFKDISKFGASINLSELYQSIMKLGYIESIRSESTVTYKNEDGINIYPEVVNGFSFAAFTDDIINLKDFEVFSQIYPLKEFQYPELIMDENRLISLIKIENENSFTLKNNEI